MREPTPPGRAALAALMPKLAAYAAEHGVRVPPPSFEEMDAEVTDYAPGDATTGVGATLTVRVPVAERYQNPMGHMQGGFLAAAVDNAVGPLSYLAAPPSATTQLAVTYLAPVTPDLAHLDVTARVAARAGRQLVVDAVVSAPDGSALAVARATQQIVRRPAARSDGPA